MKQIVCTIFVVAITFSIYAQDNPYDVFGYETKVKYETKLSEYLIIDNSNNSSNIKSIAFNLDEKFILFIDGQDSIIDKVKIEPNQLLRWLSVDPLSSKYPSLSPYNFVANTPINAIDPDGRYILFVNGLRLAQGNVDQQKWLGGGQIHSTDVYNYWRTPQNETNSFGRNVDLVQYFENKYDDTNIGFTSGSSHWNSQSSQRRNEGFSKAETFHKMVQAGDITLKQNETIKIISHSQGGAHAAGYAEQLMSYKDANGNSIYNVEVIEYITPHQPTDINHPNGPLGIQYSHPNDAVSSKAPWWMPNGGSKYGKINGIDQFYGGDIMGGKGQPPFGGATGNRNGHNVTDNDEFIKKSGQR